MKKKAVTSLSGRVAARYGQLPKVEAVALAGSQTSSVADASSDIDLYVYCSEDLALSEREAVALEFARQVEIGNCFWEPGDEWIDLQTGIKVDVMFRPIHWIEAQLARVLDECQASVGYSTCFWNNVLVSEALFDRRGWFEALQTKARRHYPEVLRQAIIAKNFPILRDAFSSYAHQIQSAVARDDRVSIQHRVTALLASYFDIVFAINRLPHPGEKRLLRIAQTRCDHLPDGMSGQVEALLDAASMPGSDVLERIDSLVEGLENVLRAEKLL
ncbi:MAG: DUF4037 domain-containing protein [Candidatus Competibacteraceae bacterium]|nr:DUF4037 domain-containing protein [Candidatus Competibacteraceae bacterium]